MTKAGRDAVLDEQMTECRELLADVRGATKDLRLAIKDAKEAFPHLAEEQVEAAVKATLEKFKEGTALAITDTQNAIFRRFDDLTNLLMSGRTSGKPKPGQLDLPGVIAQAAELEWKLREMP